MNAALFLFFKYGRLLTFKPVQVPEHEDNKRNAQGRPYNIRGRLGRDQPVLAEQDGSCNNDRNKDRSAAEGTKMRRPDLGSVFRYCQKPFGSGAANGRTSYESK